MRPIVRIGPRGGRIVAERVDRHGHRVAEYQGTETAHPERARMAPLTRAMREVTDDVGESTFRGDAPPTARDNDGFRLPDYTDAIAEPSTWMSRPQLQAFAAAHLEPHQREDFVADPDGFVQGDDWHPGLDHALDGAWREFYARQARPAVRRIAMAQTFAAGGAKRHQADLFAAGGPVVHYASGSNRPAEIRGLADAGHPIGVAADQVTANAERALVELAGRGVPVFVDSGAFSEVDFSGGTPRVVAPITDAAWRERLGLYERIGRALGPAASVVAPDRVGDQDETLQRLRRYRPELERIAATGATVLVPLQRGRRSLATFHAAVADVLGAVPWAPALPFKKEATSPEDARAYVAAVRPRRLHLLGIGLGNPRTDGLIRSLRETAPVQITVDSNKIRASTGTGASPSRQARVVALAPGQRKLL